MSAKGRGSEVVPSEFYPTPAWCVRRILEALPLPGGRWLEPSAGDGAIMRAVNEVRSDVEWCAVEIREECRAGLLALTPLVTIADFVRAPECFDPGCQVAILNPPFSLALPFVDRLLTMRSVRWIVMLQRTNWLESEGRNAFLRQFTPDLYVLPNRPSFIGDGTTDATSYAWYVWSSHHAGRDGKLTILPTTSDEERNADPRQLGLFGTPAAAAAAERQPSLFGATP